MASGSHVTAAGIALICVGLALALGFASAMPDAIYSHDQAADALKASPDDLDLSDAVTRAYNERNLGIAATAFASVGVLIPIIGGAQAWMSARPAASATA